MPFHSDFNFVLEGNVAAFRKSGSKSVASLPPGAGAELPFSALEGEIRVSAVALNFRTPTRIREVGPLKNRQDRDGGGRTVIELFNHVPFTVELIPPGQHEPVVTREFADKGFSTKESFAFTHVVGGATSKPGTWQCRIRNKGEVSAQVFVGVSAIFDREALQAAELPLQLIDHTYQIILEAITPSASISGDTATVSFGAELIDFFGNASGLLGPHSIELPSGLEGTGRLQSLDIEATSGKELLEEVVKRWQSVKTSLEEALHKAILTFDGVMMKFLRAKLAENDKWRSDYEQKVKPDFAAIHATVTFVDIHLDADFHSLDIDVTDIKNAAVHIYLAFDRRLQIGFPLVLVPPIPTGTLLSLAISFGLAPRLNEELDDLLSGFIQKASPLVARYLGEALARLSARDAVFMSLTANDFSWRVQYTPIPKEQTSIQITAAGPLTAATKFEASSVGSASSLAVGGAQPQPTGETPPEFIVRSPETLARLDQLQTIVVVMMENRSFDHMLGFLRTARGPKYEGLVGNESNLVAGRSSPVRVHSASEIIPDPVTRIPAPGPAHDFVSVRAQIDGGAMSGFAQEYEKRRPDGAEIVMSFYTDDELTTYYDLAASFKVCDHWFAAHPGPTWPNRWCTLGGTAFDIENLDRDDPNIGFIEGITIFELLDKRGIDWRIFESDLSLIRTYNRFRLNAQRVVPLSNRRNPDRGFEAMAKRGELPPVVFVEPNFSDLPPLSSANDDLVPVDLRRGQKFVNDVYRILRESPQWNDTLLVITYDEHGGFYDHVPPPGTPLGPPEFIGNIPLIHPKGANHLGVRVPAILVSPRVNAGEVSKDVFDHTSIIKTILLRHRAKFFTSDFTLFGPRVNQANHLGLALDLLRARADAPKPFPPISIKNDQPERIDVTPLIASAPNGADDFPEALRRGFLPRRPRS